MKEAYLKILYDNEVNSFYHFTDISNLESIIKYGICNRKYMDENDIKYTYTDSERLDNQKDCISLSVGTINKNMLTLKSNMLNNDWLIFEINADEVISRYFDKIYYCKYNASSPSVINLLKNNKYYLKSPIAFKHMFENDKYYLQAELLLVGNLSL